MVLMAGQKTNSPFASVVIEKPAEAGPSYGLTGCATL